MNRIVAFCLFFMAAGLLCPGTTGTRQESLEDLFSRMKKLDPASFRMLVDSVYLSLDASSDPRLKKEVTRRLFSLTQEKDEIAHIRSLTYMVLYSDTSHPRMFEEAYRLAKKHGLLKEMDYVEDRRSRYFIAQGKYDSAIIHILKMRELRPYNLDDEACRNILNLLGDTYYNTNLYDRAGEVYRELYRYYAGHRQFGHWRLYVVMNNLGQIGLKTKNYSDAFFWFSRSLRYAENELITDDRNNILAYIHLKLAETFLATGNIREAWAQVDSAEIFPPGKIREDVRQELIYIRCRLMLAEGHADEAMNEALLLIPGSDSRFSHYRFLPDVYRLLADICAARKDPVGSLKYLNIYSRAVDSLETQGRMARTMMILAEKDHQISKERLENSRQNVRMLFLGITLLAAMVIILVLLYWKLYQSRLVLVKKSLEGTVAGPRPFQHPEVSPRQEKDETGQNVIIGQLEDLMRTRKAFLDPDLSIQQTAQMLSTNRTYLSRAINGILGTSFPQYISDLRIREAIRLIREGFMVKHKQEALATACGFSSRTVFIATFKKHTGVTPSFFIANFEKNDGEGKEEGEG